MKIEIKDEEQILLLSDELLDNNNFIDLCVGGKEITIMLDELLSAVHAFEQKRVMGITREDKYQS